MKSIFKSISFYIILIVVVIAGVFFINQMTKNQTLYYGEMINEINDRNVSSIVLEEEKAVVTLKNATEVVRLDDNGNSKTIKFAAGTKCNVDIMSVTAFQEYMTDVMNNSSLSSDLSFTENMEHIPAWVEYIPYVIILIVLVVFMMIFLGQNNGSSKIMSFSRSRAKLYTSSKVKFDDVAGADEEKEEMQELVSFLKDPKKYTDLGARIPKGVLLVGPPGTGKTYLAKAVAGEAKVPFFSISGSDFVEMYVGVGAARVRDLFEQAKKNSPCIVFIDEIDAVGRHRGAGLGGGHDEREQTLNQLLVEMDGFGANEGIIMIAATNRPDILDPALTRPGRFDRKIVVGYPDIKAREAILKIHSEKKPLEESVQLSEVAKNTAGFTAADLENLMNEAALVAARNDLKAITPENIKEAVFRVIVGPEKRSRVMTEKAKTLTAYHEAGHALAVKLFSTVDKVDRISIIPAGQAGGYTAHRPDEDETYTTKHQLFEQIVVALGGRAAEDLCLGEISTGASSDLQSANNIAMSMVAKYGMSDALGNVIMNTGDGEVFLGRDYGHQRTVSEELSSLVDREVKKLIDEAYETVKKLLTDNREKLEAVTKALLEKEKLEKEEFDAIMES